MSKPIWWFSMSIVATIALVVGLSVAKTNYCPPSFEWCKPATPNYYADFLTTFKKMENPNPDPNKKEDCPELNSSSHTEISFSFCEELRTVVPDEDEIEQAVRDVDRFNNAEPSVSLIFVSSSEVVSSSEELPSKTPKEAWAKKNLAISEQATFKDIKIERKRVRDLFEATFPKVAKNSKGLGDICNNVHGSHPPYWSLACTVVTQAEKAMVDKKLQQPEWNKLPFFSHNDVLRVKYLLEVAKEAIKLQMIEDKPNATVLNKLCLLAKKKEDIQSGIAYEMNEANKGDADVQQMTEAVLTFVGEVKRIADCP